MKRYVDKSAEGAAVQAVVAGGMLQGYTSTPGPGIQDTGYWTLQEVQQADADEQAKKQRP